MESYLRLVCEETWEDEENENMLLIMAQGLGLVDVVLELIKKKHRPKSKVAILNVSKEVESQLGVKSLRGETHSKEQRQKHYLSHEDDNVLLVSSCRLFAVDALDGTLDLKSLDGIVIMEAHRCAAESSTESLAIQVFRDQQPNGWVKGFSDDAEACSRGFNKLTKIARTLGAARVKLWPRFQAHVDEFLTKRPPEVQILLASPTILTRRVQTACVQAMANASLELKRVSARSNLVFGGGPSSTAESGRKMKFDDGIVKATDTTKDDKLDDNLGKYYDDPLETCEAALQAANSVLSISAKARRLAQELRTLLDLLLSIPRLDAVAFYDAVLSVRELILGASTQTGRTIKTSDWVSDSLSLDELVAAARDRCLPSEIDKSRPEYAPKWSIVAQILADLNKNDPKGTVLIVCKEDSEVKALIEFLAPVAEPQYLKRLQRINQPAHKREPSKRSAGQRDALKAEEHFTQAAAALLAKAEKRQTAFNARRIILASHEQWRRRIHPLADWRPDSIILIDGEPQFFRQIERYQAYRRATVLLYIVTLARSVDSKHFNRMVERETDAFVQLINDKSIMLVRSPEPLDKNTTGDTSKQKASDDNSTKPQIIVDSREFRAKLPIALYNAGVQLRPATIRVGDYLLTPDIVVERKSMVDLVGSLASGRMATQVENMQRLYQTPVLLLETETSVFGTRSMPSDRAKQHHNSHIKKKDEASYEYDALPATSTTEARLTLLALHYPRLRILWCKDDRSAVKIFAALKKGSRQPTLDDDDYGEEQGRLQQQKDDGRNLVAIDLLLKLPGVTEANVINIIEHVDNLTELVSLDLIALEPLLGTANAKLLHAFLCEHEFVSQLKPPDNVKSIRYAEKAKPTLKRSLSKKTSAQPKRKKDKVSETVTLDDDNNEESLNVEVSPTAGAAAPPPPSHSSKENGQKYLSPPRQATLSVLQKKILDHYKSQDSTDNELGTHIDSVIGHMSHLASEDNCRQDIEALVSEGFLYTTLDDSHHKPLQ